MSEPTDPIAHRIKHGDTVYVGLESWAGRTYHRVTFLKVCPVRVKVRWEDSSCLRHHTGGVYYVPPSCLRENKR
jgi:hypothetical protein